MKRVMMMLAWLPLLCGAQNLKSEGRTVEDLVPDGWWHTEAVGDLNKDGLQDIVIIAKPEDNGQEDSDDEESIRPLLSIYFGIEGGLYKCWKQHTGILAYGDGENSFIDYDLKITERNTLVIGLSFFASAGSWFNYDATYVFRFQNGDFYLIGEDQHSLARNTGKDVTESYNYLTHKRQRVVSNAFDDNVKPKETWSTIPKEPLKRLGSEALY